ncbi:MAG: hypothetical protein QNI99_10515 [Woeseiaceae bacterium]|nr:hypothetical protein [Woeseiaceae bacterium]
MTNDTLQQVQQASEQWSWDLCGFVSVLCSMSDTGQIQIGHYTREAERRDLVFSLAVDFVRSIQNTPMASELQAFTRAVGKGRGYDNWTVSGFVNQSSTPSTHANLTTFGIGMTPAAVIEFFAYMKTAATGRKAQSPAVSMTPYPSFANCIIGVGTGIYTQPYDGLKHWVYSPDGNSVYTWGMEYPGKPEDIVGTIVPGCVVTHKIRIPT